MKTWKIALAAIAVAASGWIAGCDKGGTSGTSGTGADKIKIGYIVKQPEEPWFQLEWRFAEEAAAKDGFELIKLGAADGDKALAQIDNLAAGGARGFVICTPDVKLGPAIVKSAADHDLKMMTVDDQFIDADGKPMTGVHHLGIDATKIGDVAGQALAEQFKSRGWAAGETALCAVTFDELPVARDRTEGAIATLTAAGFPKDKVFKAPQRTSDIPGAIDAATILFTQHPEVKRWLICGMNDSAVLGAVRAAEGRQVPADHLCGVGINGTDCIAEFQKPQPTGFYASVLLQAREHGYRTAELVYRWAKDGVEPPLDTRTGGILIDRANYVQVRKEQGIEP